MNYSSKCKCGSIGVTLTLPKAIESLDPRACDCDFCKSHDIIYLSDPEGEILIDAHGLLKQLTQGSEQAIFWQCSSCGQIIAVTNTFGDLVKGAVNGKLFSKDIHLKSPLIVSPKLLSPTEKNERWASSWSKVSFSGK